MNRQKFLRNAGLLLSATALGFGAWRMTRKKSGDYSPYFATLNESLKSYQRSIPFLVVDLDALDKNLQALKTMIPEGKTFRIVVKSLPSLPFVDYVMQQTGSKKLMSFHQPFLSRLCTYYGNDVDILVGKPMPVPTVAYFYKTLQTPKGFNPEKQLQWLVDTPQRIEEYITLAKAQQLKMQLNMEIDVGLHRGGFDSLESLKIGLKLIAENKDVVTFSGFMGYDAHIPKVPSILLSREEAFSHECTFYERCKQVIRNEFSTLWKDTLTFNGAGSPTVALHNDPQSPLNDIAAGSFAVKPTDFDIDTLEKFAPAAYIATPILKKSATTVLPSLENFSSLFTLFDPNLQQSYYLYGGSWMANYHEPQGIKANPLFGKSTNQVMMNSSDETHLAVGDFVFLRPHQSEAVFLQFGNHLTTRNGKIIGEWEILQP